MEKVRAQRRSRAEWNRLIKEWGESGEDTEVFAERRQVRHKTLKWWIWALRREPDTPEANIPGAPLALVPLVVDTEECLDEVAEPTSWQLRTGDGHSISMCGPEALEGLQLALRAIGLDGGPR